MLREADAIVIEEIAAGLYEQIWQTFAVLLPVQTVGVMGDERTYENVVAIRAVEPPDGMTADWARLPYELLGRMSNRIINEVQRHQPRRLRHLVASRRRRSSGSKIFYRRVQRKKSKVSK